MRKLGRTDIVTEMLEKMNLYPGEVDPFWYTLAYLGLGETDKALDSIAEGLEVNPSHTAWFMRTPLYYGELQDHPRFAALLTRLEELEDQCSSH